MYQPNQTSGETQMYKAIIIIQWTQRGIEINLTDKRSIWGERRFHNPSRAYDYFQELIGEGHTVNQPELAQKLASEVSA